MVLLLLSLFVPLSPHWLLLCAPCRKMMDSGQLDFYQHSTLCTNTCRSTKFDLLISNTRFPPDSTLLSTPTSATGERVTRHGSRYNPSLNSQYPPLTLSPESAIEVHASLVFEVTLGLRAALGFRPRLPSMLFVSCGRYVCVCAGACVCACVNLSMGSLVCFSPGG